MKKTILFSISFVFLAFIANSQSTIPNASFENWSMPNGYNIPDGWDNLNPMTASMSTFTCLKGTPGSPGTAYLKLVSKNVSGMGVMPGAATCGMFDMSNMANPMPMSGFAFNQRPQSFDGKWQYMASGNDQGFIGVLLTKWNSGMMMRDTVAYAMQTLSGMAMSWANFSIPLTYMSLDYPDSAMIMLSASGATPEANSYLYADTLHFNGSVAGTTGINNEIKNISNLNVFPNPANDKVFILFNSTNTMNLKLQLTDVSGKIVFEENEGEIQGAFNRTLNISSFTKGIYFLNLKSSKTVEVRKLVVQ